MGEESGWKLVHGDVFRPAPRLELLAALVGTGVQLSLLILVVVLITIAGTLFTARGTIVTAFIILYALTSFVAGYVRCDILPYPPFPFHLWSRQYTEEDRNKSFLVRVKVRVCRMLMPATVGNADQPYRFCISV